MDQYVEGLTHCYINLYLLLWKPIERQYQTKSILQRWSLQQVEEFSVQVKFMQHEVVEQKDYCKIFLCIYEVTTFNFTINFYINFDANLCFSKFWF